jgi:hypothetical protein
MVAKLAAYWVWRKVDLSDNATVYWTAVEMALQSDVKKEFG